jgi:sulfonate transport system permease protein
VTAVDLTSVATAEAIRVPDAPTLVTLPTRPPTEAERRRRTIPRSIERLLGVALLFALWEIAARVGWLDTDTLAGPSTVFTAGSDLLREGTLTEALWASLQRVLWGAAIGIPIGTGLALVAGLSRLGDDLLDANVQMLRFVPIIALQPLLIVWLGVGETVKVSLIVLGVAFPIYVNTSAAIRAVDPRYLELAATVGLGRWQRIRRVVLPGALGGFLVGLRLATAIAWLVLVFAEQINASSGIGYLILRAQTLFQTDVIVVGLVTYAVLGLLSDAGVRALERRLLRWAPGR